MSRFTSAGRKKVIIRDATIAECKFLPNPTDEDFDIALRVEDPNTGESDWWHGECSGRYGVGNASDKTQMEMTYKTLCDLGLPDGNMMAYKKLIGIETEAMVEQSKDGKYFNVKYIGSGGGAPKALDGEEAKRRFSRLFGADGKPAPVTQVTATVEHDPFA